jgi:S1-C subfamily serine protease
MQQVQSGQRLIISPKADCRIRLRGPEAARIAVSAIGSQGGRVLAFERISSDEWWMQGMAELEGDFEVVAYITDDRHGSFANAAYPIEIELDGTWHEFPRPAEQLGAVILAEVYHRNGERRLKVSNEGFAFGIDAYARARNLQGIEIPFRPRPSPGGGSGRPPPLPGQPLGTGSGVLIRHDMIVTNAHVIEDGKSFEVGRARDSAITLAVDPLHDLALLKCTTAGTPLPLRLGSPIWLGEDIMAAGFPLMDVLGADLKVTTGNISGLTGSGGDVSRFQFSAPIGSGSSGGAIIDEFGNLVGITAASLAHDNMRDRGSISENVNFGVRAALVYELAAAAGETLPDPVLATTGNRREVTNRLRSSVVSIIVNA